MRRPEQCRCRSILSPCELALSSIEQFCSNPARPRGPTQTAPLARPCRAHKKRRPKASFLVQRDNPHSGITNSLGRAGLALVVFPADLELVAVLGGLGTETKQRVLGHTDTHAGARHELAVQLDVELLDEMCRNRLAGGLVLAHAGLHRLGQEHQHLDSAFLGAGTDFCFSGHDLNSSLSNSFVTRPLTAAAAARDLDLLASG